MHVNAPSAARRGFSKRLRWSGADRYGSRARGFQDIYGIYRSCTDV